MEANGAMSTQDVDDAELAALEKQIAEEQEKTAALQAKRYPSKVEEMKAALAVAKREREHAEVVADLEGKHGKLNDKIASFETPDGLLVVRGPTMLEWKRYSTKSSGKGGAQFEDQDELVRAVLLHPERAEYQRQRDARPGIVGTLVQLAMKLSGLRIHDLEGK
jgi:multidrug efflux pump subunit AcrA (membrane-fusion protein)